jgi:hypothetical protein
MKARGILFMILSIFSGINLFSQAKIDTSEGFIDIDMHISKYEILENEVKRITVDDTINKVKIGFQVELDNVWKENPIENANGSFFWGTGRIVYIIDKTNNFIKCLSELYNVKKNVVRLNRCEFVLVGLASDPRLIEKQFVHTKIFLNSDTQNEEYYAEVFLNIDLKNKILQFHEKDSDYRQSLINSLSTKEE